MAHPEHDAAFGRLAAARLRAASDDVRLDAHPDAETWAAYADGGLLPDEVAVLEAHLAACASCRQLMAALAPEPVVTASVPEVADTPGPARVLPFRPRATWAFMAAAAGLLGALTLWSVTRLQQPEQASTMAERTMPPPPAPTATPPAEEKAVPPSPDDALRSRVAPPAAAPLGGAAPARADELDRAKIGLEKKALDAEYSRRDRPAEARPNAPAAASPFAQASKAEAAAGGAAVGRVAANEPVTGVPQMAQPNVASQAPATQGVRGPAVNTQQQNQQALNAQAMREAPQFRTGQAAAQEQEKARAAAPAERRQEEASPPAPAALPLPGASTPAAPPAPAPEAQAAGGVAETVSVVTSPRSGARSQGFGAAKRDAGASRDRAEPALADASAIAATAIGFAEPGGRLRWRIAGGSRIESSSDAGVTWTARHPATPERLRAGSAPAIDAAWVVGERGLVLRFAVPGSWAAVTRPAAVTLVAVTASSADAARVTAEDGRVFETSDGGRSWRPVTEAPR